MAELDEVAKIKNYLKTVPNCFFWKEHGGMYGTAGIPDIIACIDGHFFGFEVKTDKDVQDDMKRRVGLITFVGWWASFFVA